MNLAGLGLDYIRWTLALADDAVNAAWQGEFRGPRKFSPTGPARTWPRCAWACACSSATCRIVTGWSIDIAPLLEALDTSSIRR